MKRMLAILGTGLLLFTGCAVDAAEPIEMGTGYVVHKEKDRYNYEAHHGDFCDYFLVIEEDSGARHAFKIDKKEYYTTFCGDKVDFSKEKLHSHAPIRKRYKQKRRCSHGTYLED